MVSDGRFNLPDIPGVSLRAEHEVIMSFKNEFIQVSGLNIFPQHRWREAILYFVNGILADEDRVTYRPKISIGDVGLRLDAEHERYSFWGYHTDVVPPVVEESATLVAGASQMEVEYALLRFVKNNNIRMLRLRMPVRGGSARLEDGPHIGELVFWKGRQRSFLGFTWSYVK